MIFITLLLIGALSIATVAGYFSIYGLAAIFSGWFWPVIAMGVVLEYGKLIMASYLYRFRDRMGAAAKAYGIAGVIVLMLLTSAGIFGFLSQGYQQDTLSLKQQEQKIVLLESERVELEEFKKERIERKKQIDNDIASLPNNYITGRQRLLESFGPELKALKEDIAGYTARIKEITLEISTTKQEKLVNEVHIGPIIFIAQAFDLDTDTAVKWLILMIIFVFDPMAVMLTLAANNAILQRDEQKNKKPIDKITKEMVTFDEASNLTPEALRDLIDEVKNHDMSAEDVAYYDMLEEMLNKKLVTQKIRNHKQGA